MSNSNQDMVALGRWKSNAGLLQLLSLCPLLAVSSSVVNALGLSLATLLVLWGSNLLMSLFRAQLVPAIRLPAFVVLIAALTTCAELLLQAYAFALYQALGIFIPLIVSTCMLLGRAERVASEHSPLPALREELLMGIGFLLLLVVLGAFREVLGTGALFADLDRLLPFAAHWKLQVFNADAPFLLAILPPGAFLILGFLIALKNVVDDRLARSKPPVVTEAVVAGSKRVRVTG